MWCPAGGELRGTERETSSDSVLRDEVVLGLVQSFVAEAKAIWQVDETGHRTCTYLVEEDLVLKPQHPSQVRPETGLAKKMFFLNRMQNDARIRVPRVLGYAIDDGIEYTAMTRMSGTATRWVTFGGTDRCRILHDFGRNTEPRPSCYG